MSLAADTAGAAPKASGKLDDLMLAMDVVDTLRHRADLVARELNEAGREDALLEKLRDIYRQQGIAVPDHILKDGVKALKEQRFVYSPPGQGIRRTLATLYVRRSVHGKRVLAIVVALIAGWGVWQFAVVQPGRQAEEAARVELVQTLPTKLSATFGEIMALSSDQDARARAQALRGDAERALQRGDRETAARSIGELASLREVLAQEYVLTIVSRPGAETGVWRRPPRNPLGRNHYLIVEAVAPDGRKLTLPIRNEESGETESVTMFGVRVPQEMFDRIARDKRDDGIVQFNRFGVKRRGQMTADYLMPFEGGMITKW
jgi:hypothetical protein